MPLDKIQEKFLHEAADLLDDLERSVLALEKNRTDRLLAEEVFRVMHTFKGTAKMFGYDAVGEFTHYLENIFDDVRARKLSLTDEVLDLSLGSVDHIRKLLDYKEKSDAKFYEHHVEVITKLKQITDVSSDSPVLPVSAVGTFYLVSFSPFRDFLKDGNNPLYLLEDISALGSTYLKTNASSMPTLDSYQPDAVYLSWDILLYSESSLKEIRDEFIFVEESCTLKITELGHVNYLDNKQFINFVDQLDNISDASVLKTFIKNSAETSTSNSSESAISLNTVNQTIKVTYEKIDKLMGIVSELVTTQARLSLFADSTRHQELDEISENVEKLVRQLRDEAFSISLLPVSHLSTRFERLVRDTSKELSKKIRFLTKGGDTELDKKIIDNLMDPMLHLLRNSIDHGIEMPSVRKSKGKDETGTIELRSYYSGTYVVVEIRDDGGGIDTKSVFDKAVEKGIITGSEELSEREIFDLIFHPGFSTTEKITNVSGRGVGMDVVKSAIKNLRGEIEVDSKKNKGTIIRLKLPLSLSIIDGLLVKVDESRYVIPLTAIDKCYEINSQSIKPDMNDLIVLDGEKIPYINLRQIFQYGLTQPEHVNLIVARHEDRKVALCVDNIIDEYQAVIKPLGKAYKDQDFASGATILGNGLVALVLDTNRLINSIAEN